MSSQKRRPRRPRRWTEQEQADIRQAISTALELVNHQHAEPPPGLRPYPCSFCDWVRPVFEAAVA